MKCHLWLYLCVSHCHVIPPEEDLTLTTFVRVYSIAISVVTTIILQYVLYIAVRVIYCSPCCMLQSVLYIAARYILQSVLYIAVRVIYCSPCCRDAI